MTSIRSQQTISEDLDGDGDGGLDGDGEGFAADGGTENGRKRIRQACLNCRRKKVRCGGEKPVCDFCNRLSQQCVYTEDGRSQRHRAVSGSIHLSSNESSNVPMGILDPGISALDDKLSRVEETLGRFESLLSTMVQNQPLSSHQNTIAIGRSPISASVGMLPATEVLPSLSRFDRPPTHTLLFAADVYFRFCHNQPYSLFHEATFRQRLVQGELPEHQLWALLATARRYSTLPDLQLSTTDDALFYAKRAWECINPPWDGSARDEEAVQLIQSIIMIVGIEHPGTKWGQNEDPRAPNQSWLQKRSNDPCSLAGQCSSAFMKLGFAVRMAQLNKMYMEPDAALPVICQEERRRTFWSLYLQDKLISLARDRFPNLRNEECSVSLPCSEANFRDGIADPTAPKMEAFMCDCLGTETIDNCSPLALITVMASVLSRVSQYVLQQNRYVQLGPPWSATSPYSSIAASLLQLEMHFGLSDPCIESLQRRCVVKGAVDQHLAGSFIYAKTLFHLSQCLLHHPFLLQERLQILGQKAPPSFLRTAWDTCRMHAKSLTDLKDMRNHNVITMTSFYGYGVMVAGTIHVLAMNDGMVEVQEEGSTHFKAAMDFLTDLSCYWKHASLMASRLARFSIQNKDRPQPFAPFEQDAKALWQSVDYALLSTPTRPASPTFGNHSPDEANLHMSFNQLFDFTDFGLIGDSAIQGDSTNFAP